VTKNVLGLTRGTLRHTDADDGCDDDDGCDADDGCDDDDGCRNCNVIMMYSDDDGRGPLRSHL